MTANFATQNSTATSSRSSLSAGSQDDIGEPPLSPSEQVEIELSQARELPSGFMSSLSAWWGSTESASKDSELRLLRRLPFFRTENQPDVAPTASNPNPITARVSQVTIPTPPSSSKRAGTEKRWINTLTMSTPESRTPDNKKRAVVMTHGYGAAMGFMYRNWQAMGESAAEVNRSAYAIDWLGMGRSARPDPRELAAGKKATVKERVEKAEDFFLESLEAWREAQGIETMTLIGHSLGGYLSLAFALKYPSRVDRLVLLSPAGIPENPYAPTNGDGVNVEEFEAAAKELGESQKATISAAKKDGTTTPLEVKDSNHPPEAHEAAGTERKRDNIPKPPTGRTRQLFAWAWEQGWSPFGIVRNIGPWGPMMVARYSSRRFAALAGDELRDMHDYCWSITRAKGSSEYCISHLLAPGAFARMPMVNRVTKLNMPVLFSYGDHDWMDIQGGHDAVKKMKEAGNNQGKVVEIPHAGHHLYLDNPKRTNAMLRAEILAAGKSTSPSA
ncbi:hypothetical protein NliqN6_5105 [Naganishia liquefaciens]|uniref:AB hydrolase-1 domain-containing protein n=1 Tax=Naganishia liquefaciens TaxID=104408 RepID=A0A8H3YGV6_9TREE|nr:hypothetical protein NliqN6_5105 [Naganishia liquefaciens]